MLDSKCSKPFRIAFANAPIRAAADLDHCDAIRRRESLLRNSRAPRGAEYRRGRGLRMDSFTRCEIRDKYKIPP